MARFRLGLVSRTDRLTDSGAGKHAGMEGDNLDLRGALECQHCFGEEDLILSLTEQPLELARDKVAPMQMRFLFFVSWCCFFPVCNPACISKLHSTLA